MFSQAKNKKHDTLLLQGKVHVVWKVKSKGKEASILHIRKTNLSTTDTILVWYVKDFWDKNWYESRLDLIYPPTKRFKFMRYNYLGFFDSVATKYNNIYDDIIKPGDYNYGKFYVHNGKRNYRVLLPGGSYQFELLLDGHKNVPLYLIDRCIKLSDIKSKIPFEKDRQTYGLLSYYDDLEAKGDQLKIRIW